MEKTAMRGRGSAACNVNGPAAAPPPSSEYELAPFHSGLVRSRLRRNESIARRHELVVRSPSVFSDSSLSPSFLRTMAARKARTVWGAPMPSAGSLMSERRILCFKPALRLERRGQQRQKEA